MNKVILVIGFLFCLNIIKAQSGKEVKWTFTVKKVSDKKYELIASAVINKGWHLYSQNQSKDAIALPTEFKFNKNPLVALDGKVKENGKLIATFDKATQSNSNFYSEKVDFVQTLTLKKAIKTTISGSVKFMVCDDKQCLPPTSVSFTYTIE